jgi:hypothetical protein
MVCNEHNCKKWFARWTREKKTAAQATAKDAKSTGINETSAIECMPTKRGRKKKTQPISEQEVASAAPPSQTGSELAEDIVEHLGLAEDGSGEMESVEEEFVDD